MDIFMNALNFDPHNNTICPIKRLPYHGANCSDAAGNELDYSVIKDILFFNSSGRRWNSEFQSPFFNFMDQNEQVYQIWYDDPQSLVYKYSFAHQMNLRGVGMWTADFLAYNAQDSRERKDTRAM